jgi:alpha-D-ribose 1-methylphosphonate 5-triphosphate synthase subunit PhnL
MLSVNHLSKMFVAHILDGREITGFAPICFEVAAGRALGLSGPSGSGKSSVLKCIYRTYRASTGTITYHSARIGRVDLTALGENEMLQLRRSEIGYVTQFLSVLPRMTALDVVAEPLLAGGMPRDRARRRAKDLLSRLGISQGLHEAFPCTFSGGEQQRVNLARAVVRPLRLLLLDEPTASLDRSAMQVVLEILTELKAAGTTMIAVFHDHATMAALVDDVFHLPPKDNEPCPSTAP